MSDVNYQLATSTWDEEEFEAISSVVQSGRFSMGAHVAQFEREFAKFAETDYAVMVNSGSSANLLMVASLFYRCKGALKRGDEVIVPAVSWSTTYFPLSQYGLKLKFVDIDADTLNFDLQQLESAISEKTRAVMVVNLLGNPNNFDVIDRIIGDRDVLVIEDNCESLGATFNGRQAGTIGLMGTFSCFFSHHIATMEGGLVVTDDEELYHILLSLRAHGWTRNLPDNNHVSGKKNDDEFFESYKFVLPGFNVRPLEMSGAIGVRQLKKIPDLIRGRRENAKKFISLASEYPEVRIQKEIGESSWFGFSLTVNPEFGVRRSDLIKCLRKHGVEFRPIVGGNFLENPVMKWLDYSIHGELPNAAFISDNGLMVGNNHVSLSDEFVFLKAALDETRKLSSH